MTDEAEDNDQPAHETANLDTGSMKPINQRRSIKDLGLDVKAAKTKTFRLFPIALRRQYSPHFGKTYPLPASLNELTQICELEATKNSQDAASVYVRRARRKYLEKIRRRTKSAESIETDAKTSYMARWRFDKQLEKNKAEVRSEMDKFRTEIARATASLSSLYDQTRKIWEMQMDAYINDREVNGEKINAAAARAVAKDITNHVARIGMPSEQHEDAEDAVFEQVAKAKEAIEKSIRDEVEPETQH